MGKGFKLPGKLPGAPVKVAMPAIQSGGSYRNPAMIIDRSAEILGAGIQSGMDKIGDALKQKAMDKMAEEKGQEPQSNVEKEVNKEKSRFNKITEETSTQSNLNRFNEVFPEFATTNAKGLDSGFFMVDDELAAVGAPVDLPETPLQMKNDSPNKFLGAGISAAFGGGSGVNNSGLTREQMQNAIAPGGKFVGIGNVGKAISQAQQAAAASTAAGGTIGTPDQNPMSGGASGGQTLNCTPVAMSYDPPLQANEKGGKTPVFNLATQGMAETAFGTPAERQASVKAPFQSNAFYAALNDAKEKGASTFEVGGKKFDVK
jgi:hypothetical protein